MEDVSFSVEDVPLPAQAAAPQEAPAAQQRHQLQQPSPAMQQSGSSPAAPPDMVCLSETTHAGLRYDVAPRTRYGTL